MDRSITQDIDTDTARRALATALVVFAGEIGAIIIAEGVETGEEILALRRAGILRAQGFALAPPATLPLDPVDYTPAAIANLHAVDDPEEAELSSPPALTEEERRSQAIHRVQAAVAAARAAETRIEDSVSAGRDAGLTWGELAEVLGMTRQGASKRYRRGQQLQR